MCSSLDRARWFARLSGFRASSPIAESANLPGFLVGGSLQKRDLESKRQARAKAAGIRRFPRIEGFRETEEYESVPEDNAAGPLGAIWQKARM